MFKWLKRHGLDGRFVMFVLTTMLLSSAIGGVIAGFAAFLLTGKDSALLLWPFLFLLGGGYFIPIAFVIWLLPSALTFAVTLSICRRRYAEKPAAQ